MNENLNVNSGKKIVIVLSILFSTLILIIGTTTAFFSQGASDVTGNIVSNDELSLEYNDDDNNYMRQGLIPASRENAIYAYNKEENKCEDDYGYSACSIYRFSIKNTANVSQRLLMTLHPTANSYTNLKFLLYEVTDDGSFLRQDTSDLIKDSLDSINLYESFDLNSNELKIYELVFYIEAKNYDQTEEDAGKQFGAGIKINSITTGKYIVKNFGAACWSVDSTDTSKLVAFNGINMTNGEIDELCTGYVSKDASGYYSINIPSSVGGQPITTIGNKLFTGLSVDDNEDVVFNKYQNIKEINIEEGITEIEDGDLDSYAVAFGYIGFGVENSSFELNVTFPSSLESIGVGAFLKTRLKSIYIPKSVKTIGNNAFITSERGPYLLSEVIFETDDDGSSSLTSIGDYAFQYGAINSLVIPSSVEYIGEHAFDNNLTLTQVTFNGALDGKSKLNTIGTAAFSDCNLTYTSDTAPLILPSTITTMGTFAFGGNYISDLGNNGNYNLKYIYFPGSTSGFGNSWNGDAEVLAELESSE